MKLLMTAVLAAIVTSCTPMQNTKTEASNTVNKTWELVSLDGQQVNATLPVYISLDGTNKVSGKTGCNTLIGNYSITNGTQIRFSRLASSRMMCAPADMNIEKDVLEVLNTAGNFTLSDGKLMLNVGRRAPLAVFAEMSTNPVLNKYWKLTVLDGKPVTMEAAQEREAHFILRSDGSISGFGGCNGFSGSYELKDNNRILFNENMAVTMRTCTELKMDERAYLNVFHNADSYTLNGDTLHLKKGNSALAVFEAIYF